MQVHRSLLVCVVLVGVLVGLAGLGQAAQAAEDMAPLVQGINSLALKLYANLKQEGGNVVFSPYAVSYLLALPYAGARGKTAARMSRMLHFGGEPAEELQFLGTLGRDLVPKTNMPAYEWGIANALWLAKGQTFSQPYLALLQGLPNTTLKELDFTANLGTVRKAINGWAAKQSGGKIRSIVSPDAAGPETKLALTSTAHFKGTWASCFNPDYTTEASFTVNAGSTVNVPTMNQTAEFNYMEEKTFQGLELPYRDGQLSMTVFLPRTNDGLAEFESSLNAENLAQILTQFVRKPVSVYFPRFSAIGKLSLAQALRETGLGDAFSAPPADFSGITGAKDLALAEILHAAVIEVSEKGNDVRGSETGEIEDSASVAETEFVADHPFLFLIRDTRSGMILFMGRIVNPKQP
jgi:serine protease inhibitor